MEYVLIGVIALLVAFWIITPLLRPAVSAPTSSPAATLSELQRDDLTELRDTLLRNLKDVEFDKSMGKINDDEYTSLRADMTAQVSEVLDRIERFSQAPAAQADSAGASVFAGFGEASFELEVLVARFRRRAKAAS